MAKTGLSQQIRNLIEGQTEFSAKEVYDKIHETSKDIPYRNVYRHLRTIAIKVSPGQFQVKVKPAA